jgi:hypothetical protein
MRCDAPCCDAVRVGLMRLERCRAGRHRQPVRGDRRDRSTTAMGAIAAIAQNAPRIDHPASPHSRPAA